MAKTADLLFELGTEELPPTALARLSDALLSEFRNGLDANAIEYSAIEAFAAPRRLAILVTDCLVQQPDVTVNRRGPAVQAAFDKVGQPTKAATGFAASCNTTVDQLDRTATDKGEWLSFNVVQKGRETAELLPAIAEAALDKLPIPKRMRWGDSTAMFVRPVHWLVFLLGENIVPCRLLDTDSNRFTYGHRFHHPAAIELSHPQEYLNKLRAEGKVIANFEERRLLISEQVAAAASQLGGQIAHDADLLDEVTALVEWPVPIVGEFEESFLAVPHEALIMTMKKNQKYFPVFDSGERLLNRFIAIANIESSKPDTIRSGNERVIRPRLADAKFFWDQDARITLEGRLEKLADIVFQQQLGSILDKSQRVSELASLIASQIGGDPSLAARAGLLSRCDLVTEMVFEFPEMQGIMGRYQAGRDGEDSEVALAMDEIYMPRFSGDELPSSKTGIAVALADRIDTLTGIFGINLKPSGTKDPFALRRAALGIIRIMREYSLTLNLSDLIGTAYKLLKDRLENEATISDVVEFINERLKGVFIDAGFSANLVKAVASVNPADIPDFEKRLQAVKTFSELPQSDQLAAANKRISNILKKIDGPVPQVSDAGLSDSDHERALFSAVSEKQQSTRSLLDKFDYQSVLLDLAQSSTVIDEFFEHVMVMADDEKIRLNRLALLNDVRNLFLEVADISVLQDV
jgi:glycyl-tRNA synthetase beta chain